MTEEQLKEKIQVLKDRRANAALALVGTLMANASNYYELEKFSKFVNDLSEKLMETKGMNPTNENLEKMYQSVEPIVENYCDCSDLLDKENLN